MSKSPNIGLTLTPQDELNKSFREFRTELAGSDNESNMMIIDREIGNIKERNAMLDSSEFTWGMLRQGLGFKDV